MSLTSAQLNRRHCNLSALSLWLLGSSALAAGRPGQPRQLLVLGDSISAEYGLPRGSGWVALLTQRLQARGWSVINASISGDTTAGGRQRLPALLARHQPHVVVIELGGNDALRGLPLEQTRAHLVDMVRAARRTGAQVLLLGMQVPPNYGRRYAESFRDLFKGVAQQEKVALLPFLLAGLADVPDAARWFQADMIHPNQAAQPQLLNRVWPVLQPLLD